jgi:hypothetical protein
VDRQSPIDYWQRRRAGLRGSTLLRLGALLVLLSAGSSALGKAADRAALLDFYHMAFAIPWALWIVSLLVLAAGFIVTGYRSYMSPMGWVTGTFHLGHGLDLFTMIFAAPGMGFSPAGMALAKYLTVILFGYAEQARLGRSMRNLLIVAAGAQVVKIGWRTFAGLDSRPSWLLDMALLMVLAWSYWRLARHIRYQEDLWAARLANAHTASFEDFNNPEHRSG